ncbi:hypothetical protein KSP39_PZI012698 [Platanthera zijinensis]|uniref:Uncharacterized protein n=1 Tax=Platanthera zijinensis TaxID=2320716 RepID=A0AAP0BFG8_9ASPA
MPKEFLFLIVTLTSFTRQTIIATGLRFPNGLRPNNFPRAKTHKYLSCPSEILALSLSSIFLLTRFLRPQSALRLEYFALLSE